MAREKSRLTEPMMYALGKILKATIDDNITEDIIRTVCRNIGISAVSQGELNLFLKDFRATYNSPQEKLEILAQMVPDGLFAALLLVAQQFAMGRFNQLYEADMSAVQSLQNKLIEVENAKAEACSALSAKEFQYENVAKQLTLMQETVSRLNERILGLEVKNSYLQGIIDGNKPKSPQLAAKGGRSRAKVAATTNKKNRPQKKPSQAVPEATLSETPLPIPADSNGVWGGSTEPDNPPVFT